MASTYTPIATTTLGSTTQTISFTSIPSTYTDLVIIGNGTATTGVSVLLRFNGDTGSNYSVTYIDGNGTSASSYRDTNYTGAYGGSYYSGSSPSMSIINIMNYANTTTYKTQLTRDHYVSGTIATASLWRSTAAINRVDLTANLNGFASGTTWTLYGIKAA